MPNFLVRAQALLPLPSHAGAFEVGRAQGGTALLLAPAFAAPDGASSPSSGCESWPVACTEKTDVNVRSISPDTVEGTKYRHIRFR